MNIEGVADACGIKLNKYQRKADSQWLTDKSDAAIGTGRTTWCALNAICKAMNNPGTIIYLEDHFVSGVDVIDRVVMGLIENMVDESRFRMIDPPRFRMTKWTIIFFEPEKEKE